MFQANLYGIMGVLTIVMCWAFAIVLYRIGAPGGVARKLAVLLAAAVVVFFLAPLQRFAEGVASVAMPNTQNTPEYAAHRKMQVYEAALTEALPDGKISERARGLLDRLRDSLGISIADADAIERELQEGLPSIG